MSTPPRSARRTPPPTRSSPGSTPSSARSRSAPARARCACSPGAGTGKTRAITHRIAYGVHSGVYQPQRVLARDLHRPGRRRDAHPAARPRRRRRAGPHLPRRRAAPAALLLAAGDRRRRARGDEPQGSGRRRGRRPAAAAVRPHRHPRPRRRDRVGQGQPADPASRMPRRARAQRREPPGPRPHGDGARSSRPTRRSRATAASSTSRTSCCSRSASSTSATTSPAPCAAQYRHFVVDEYQDVNALQQRLLDLWLGERDDLCVVGDPAQTIYSFTGASPRHLLGFPTRYPEAQVVRLVRNYRSTPQIVGLANLVVASGPRAAPRAARCELLAQGRAGPAPELTAHPDDPAEAAAVAAAHRRALVAGGHPAGRDRRSCSAPTPSPRPSSRRWPTRGVPYLVRGGERFFARKEVRDAILLLRGAARSDDGAEPLPELVRDVLLGAGLDPRGARRAAGPPASAGSRWPPSPRSPTTSRAAAPEARLPELVRELDERAAGPARPGRPGRHAGVAARGQGPGVGRRLPRRLLRRPHADLDGRDPRGHRGGAPAALRRASPGPASELLLSWSGRAHPGRPGHPPAVAVPRRRRRASSVRAPARSPASGGAKGGRRQGRKPALPAHCRGCGAELVHRRPAQDRPLRRLPAHLRRGDVRAAARRGGWPSRAAASVPAYVVFTDATLTAIAEREPGSRGRLAQISGVGARKLEHYGAQVLAILGGADAASLLENASAATESDDIADRFTEIVTGNLVKSVVRLARRRVLLTNVKPSGLGGRLGPASRQKEVGPDGEHHDDDRRDADRPASFPCARAASARSALRPPVSGPRGPLCPRRLRMPVSPMSVPRSRATSAVSAAPPPPAILTRSSMSFPPALESHLSRPAPAGPLQAAEPDIRDPRPFCLSGHVFRKSTIVLRPLQQEDSQHQMNQRTRHRSRTGRGPPPGDLGARPVTEAPSPP